MAENRRDVVVRFLANTGQLEKGTDVVRGRLSGVATGLKGIASLGAVVGAISFFTGAIKEAEEAERITRKTEAVLKSTGQSAGVTAGQVGALAEKLSDLAGVDDEVIQQGANVLLTFTNVRNEVGRGNDVFNQASTVALDMAAALDKTGDSGAAYQENVIRIGKALQDPIAGLTALRKVGVNFDTQQRAQITTMVEAGDVMGAQKIILAELNKEFGGMAEANATASGKAAVAWSNFAEAVGTRVMPAVNAVGEWLVNTGIPKLDALADTVGDAVVPALRGLVSAGGEVVEFWQGLPGPVQAGAIAMGAWMLIGDRVEGLFGRMSGGARGLGSDVKTAMGAFDVGRVQGTFMAMEERLPVVGQMGQAFRDQASQGVALGRAFGGLQGNMSAFGAAAQGVGMAAFTGLKAAAGGLLSFIGGPWGLAFAGAAVGLALFAKRSQEVAQHQAALEKAAKGVADEIVRQNGVLGQATRKAAAKAAEDAGLLDNAEHLGIALSDVTDVIEGQAGAYQKLQGEIKKRRDLLEDDADAAVANNDEERLLAIQLEDRELQDLANGLAETTGKRNNNVEAARRQEAAEKGAADGTRQSTEAEQAATDAAKEHQEAVDGLLDSLRKYWGESAAAVDSSIAWEEQWDALAQSVKDNGTSLDTTSEAGRNNATTLGDLIKTSQTMMTQDIASGVTMDVATQKHVDRTNALIEEARRNNLDADAVAGLVAQYNGVPKDVTTWLSQKGFDAVKQNLTWLTAIQTLLKDGIEATPDAINARMKKASGYTSSGREDYAGGRASGGPAGLIRGGGNENADNAGVYRLAHNEFVQRASATRYYGVDFMSALNDRRIPKEALPGLAGGGLALPYPVNVSKTMIPSIQQVTDSYYARHPEANKIGRMQAWAKQQAGKLYQWGAVGPGNYDCSGLVGNLYAMAKGLPMYRRYMTTAAMGPGKFGMAAGPGKVTVYLGPGHTAANIGGLHAEAYGGNGVPLAVGRVGTPLSYYNQTMHLTGLAKGGLAGLKRDPLARAESFAKRGWPEPTRAGAYRNGGWLNPGELAYNETRKPERILNDEQWDALAKSGSKVEKHYHLTMQTRNYAVDVETQFARMEMAGGL